MALAHLVVLVPHDGGAVDVGGNLPAEGLIEQIVLGGGGEIFAAPDHVGDAHEVVVHHVGEVVGGQAVPLQEHLVVQGLVLHGDVAKAHVVEGGGPLLGDALADDVGHSCQQIGVDLLLGEFPAGVRRPAEVAAVLLGIGFLAEAVVGRALLHQELGVLPVEVPALRLDIGPRGAANVGALVVGQAALGHGAVNHVRGALHQAALVRVLNAEDEGAVVMPGDEPGVQGGAEIAHVHVARGGRGEAGADRPLGDAVLHVLEKAAVGRHR